MPSPNHLSAKGDKRGAKTIQRSESMKAEYDFSKAERGKFFRPDAAFSFPIYLEPDVGDFINELAEQKQIAIQDLVNEWLRANMKLIQSIQ
ncbi:MAG: hypothetical protein ABI977_18005 [Acidobacteriota bacterium]